MVAHFARLLEGLYEIERRRFLRDFSEEAPPPEFTSLGREWVYDLVDLGQEAAEIERVEKRNWEATLEGLRNR